MIWMHTLNPFININIMNCKLCQKDMEHEAMCYHKKKTCSRCSYNKYKEYLEKNPEKRKQYNKIRNDNFYAKPECRERKLSYVRSRMVINKERWYAYLKVWRTNNPELSREYQRKSYRKRVWL